VALHPVEPARAPLAVRLSVPPAKSLQQRALALALLADGRSTIVAGGAPAGDSVALAAALSSIAGRDVPPAGDVDGAWTAAGLGPSRRSLVLDLRRNATGLRLSLVLAALRPPGARTLLRGDPRLLERPHGPLLRALTRLGAVAHRRRSGAIRVVARPLALEPISLDASASSQFATALLLGAPRMGGIDLRLVGRPVSQGYLDLTLAALAAFSVPVVVTPAGPHAAASRFVVPAAVPRATRFVVEPDASSAAVWWAAAAMAGGAAEVEGLPADTRQPDAALLPVLSRMGATVERTPAGEARVRASGDRLVGAGDVDLRASPDLAPLVAALAAGASGRTRVVHAPHLRLKESARIAACVAAVRAVGGAAEEAADGFVVDGGDLHGGVVDVRGDHRIALAFGALGLRVEGVVLGGAEAVEKSYPGFLEVLAAVARDGV
jgi:3-phosphoshikimate 1-carboxyvinyltransferase